MKPADLPTQASVRPSVPAREIVGIACLVFLLNSVLGVAGKLFGFAGEGLHFVRILGWALTVLLLAIAGIVHSHQRRVQA